jgi:pimeloyl-ACP methyl ester carboxylesterase
MFLPGSDESLVERVVADMSSAPAAVALPAMETAFTCQPDVVAALSELELPVIAINPDNRPSDTESLGRHGVDVVRMPWVGHFPMMEDPEGFNRILRKVVEKLLR